MRDIPLPIPSLRQKHSSRRPFWILLLATSLLLTGCASFPEIVSSDSFSGTVLDRSNGRPVPGILVYGAFSSSIAAWDNSGNDGPSYIVTQNYAISDSVGHFTFPALFGVVGPAFYEFGQGRSVIGPDFELAGHGYHGSAFTDHHKMPLFYVEENKPESPSSFGSYLQGRKALSFRKVDYPALLQLLNQWYLNRNQIARPDEATTQLYLKYKTLFESNS